MNVLVLNVNAVTLIFKKDPLLILDKGSVKSLPDDDLIEIAKSLAFTMKTAREYFESADRVSLLTQPLLLFYGMTALSKVPRNCNTEILQSNFKQPAKSNFCLRNSST